MNNCNQIFFSLSAFGREGSGIFNISFFIENQKFKLNLLYIPFILSSKEVSSKLVMLIDGKYYFGSKYPID